MEVAGLILTSITPIAVAGRAQGKTQYRICQAQSIDRPLTGQLDRYHNLAWLFAEIDPALLSLDWSRSSWPRVTPTKGATGLCFYY